MSGGGGTVHRRLDFKPEVPNNRRVHPLSQTRGLPVSTELAALGVCASCPSEPLTRTRPVSYRKVRPCDVSTRSAILVKFG